MTEANMADPGSLRNLADEADADVETNTRGSRSRLATHHMPLAAAALRGAADRIEQLEGGRGKAVSLLRQAMRLLDRAASLTEEDDRLYDRLVHNVGALLDEQETPDMTRASLVQKEQP